MKGKNLKFLFTINRARTVKLILFLLFVSASTFSQVSGDYGANSSGTWGTTSIWKIYNGVSWASSPLAGAAPNSSAINIFILPGVTVTLTTSQTPCNNLTINSTGKLYTNSAGSNVYIYVYGNIQCDGVIGNGATFDAISFGIEGVNCLFTGTGAVDCSRIRKNLSAIAITNLTIDININLRFGTGSQTQIYNSADNTTFNVTVNFGKTVSLTGNAGNIGNVAMDGIAGNDFSERGGNYLINGTVVISGTLYLTTNNASLPCTVTIGATGIIQTASVIANTSGSAKHTLTMINGGLLQITGTPFSNPFTLTNNIYNLNAGSTIEYSAAGIQTIDSNVTYANLKTSGSGNKTGAGPIDVNGNLTITGTSVLIPYVSNPIINVGGNWTNYNTAGFTETGSSVTLNGSGNQTISVSGGENFNNLLINKTAGKVITSTAPSTIVRIAGTLNLTWGLIQTSATSYVLIQSTANVVNVNDNSFVEGPCARQGNTVFTFPIGKIAKYRPLAISAPPLGTTLFIAEYFKVDPQAIPTTITSVDPTIDHISRCEYWMMRASATTSLILTPSWDNSYSCGVTSLPDMAVAAWNGSVWKDLGNSGTSGTTAFGTVTASTSYSIGGANVPITLATTSPLNPLPIELIYFNARTVDGKVELTWKTATEINNDYFVVERSTDGVDFEFVSQTKGSGTTSQEKNYSSIDFNPISGISYYRLKQVDFDGKSSLSNLVPVNLSRKNSFTLFPNPVENQLYVILPDENTSEISSIRIFDVTGRQVYEIAKQPASIYELPVSNFTNGTYSTIITFQDGTIKHSFFVKN